jgi:hypothetical protein
MAVAPRVRNADNNLLRLAALDQAFDDAPERRDRPHGDHLEAVHDKPFPYLNRRSAFTTHITFYNDPRFRKRF